MPFQIAADCGAPAGIAARRGLMAARAALTSPSVTTVGFVGLGHMGGVLAANLVAGDFLPPVVAHDAAGPDPKTGLCDLRR